MISIIIPIYNHAKIITKCLDSILKQTYQDYEIIIINDGSTDGLEKVLENYLQTNSIRLAALKLPLQIFNQENKGAAAARNNGFKKSKGEHLFFCDADAVLKPEALQKMYDELSRHQEAGYVYSSFLWGRKIFKLFPFDVEKLKKGPFIHTMALIRREYFPAGGWDESVKKFQDWDLWLTMLEQGYGGFWVDAVLFTVKPGGTISGWLPSFAYRWLPFLPNVKKYNRAMEIIKKKHNLHN